MHRVLQPEGWIRPADTPTASSPGGARSSSRDKSAGMGKVGSRATISSRRLRNRCATSSRCSPVTVPRPEHVTSLVWYLIDKREYVARLREVGKVYREIMGRHFPAMTAVQVSALIEDRAKVEIQATAVVPDGLEYVSSRPGDG